MWPQREDATLPLKYIVVLCALGSVMACSKAPAEGAPATRVSLSSCLSVEGGVQLDSARIGSVPLAARLEQVKATCPSARVDTVPFGGIEAAALTIDVPGASISAAQTCVDAETDTLRFGRAADLWVASGDSLRFADGTPVPHRVGQLRARHLRAVVVIDHGDDGTGSYIVLCRYQYLRLIVSNVWPPGLGEGVLNFASISPADTALIWRAEIERRPRDARIARACRNAPAT